MAYLNPGVSVPVALVVTQLLLRNGCSRPTSSLAAIDSVDECLFWGVAAA